LDIDTPGLNLGISKLESLERNCDFAYPAVIADVRFGEPDAVPTGVHLAAFVAHLRVPLCAGGVDREHVSVASVMECVENDLDVVALTRFEILFEITDDDAAGFAIMRNDSKVEIVVVVKNLDFGLLRCGVAL